MEAPQPVIDVLSHHLLPIPGWESKPLWRFDSDLGPAVLKRLSGPATKENLEYFNWEFELLAQLDRIGFSVQRPLPLLQGEAIKEIEGSFWTTYLFVPGESVSWTEPPSLEEQGVFLARFHAASSRVSVDPRPHITPIEGFFKDVLSSHPSLGNRAEEVATALAALRTHGEIVMHGDLSCDNMLADKGKLSGVIDFGMAQHHHPLVDLGFALWRTARPFRKAVELDPARIARYIRGYLSHSTLPPDLLKQLPSAIIAKGLFLVSLIQRGGPFDEALTMARLEWLFANEERVHRAINQ